MMGRRSNGNGQRRPSGGAFDLLRSMQPTTKALAQMLAGTTRVSGQLAQARNILAQATRAVDERQIDRLAPSDREEFLEQYARLKLTIADAEAMEERLEQEPTPVARVAPPVAPERLRELAMRLAGPSAEAAAPPAPEPPTAEELAEAAADARREAEDAAAREAADAAEDAATADRRTGAAHRQPRLRLKSLTDPSNKEPADIG
jgi:hypothetical protein